MKHPKFQAVNPVLPSRDVQASFKFYVERPMLRFIISAVQTLFEEYEDKNVFHEKTALRETPWGTREFAFYDPDQNGLTFYCNLGET